MGTSKESGVGLCVTYVLQYKCQPVFEVSIRMQKKCGISPENDDFLLKHGRLFAIFRYPMEIVHDPEHTVGHGK